MKNTSGLFLIFISLILASCTSRSASIVQTGIVQIGPSGNALGTPIWSPDGKLIVTTSQTNVQTYTAEIFVLDLATNDFRSLVKTDYGSLQAMSWSPDGESIAFVAEGGTEWKEGIWVIDVNGAKPAQFITEGYDVAWSPDGKSLAVFSMVKENSNQTCALSILDLMTMNKKEIFSRTGKYINAIGLAWSPDGTKLMFSIGMSESDTRPRFPKFDIDVIDIETGEIKIITNGKVNDDPTWSPDGKLIAFISSSAGKFDLELIISNIDGSCPKQITKLAWSVDWSPDGRKIAFGNAGNIYIMDINEYLGYDLMQSGLICTDT